MNVPAYIESGIIEEFCLGLLPDDLAKEVVIFAGLYPEIQREIESVEATLSVYATTSPVPEGRQKMLDIFHQLALDEYIDIYNPPLIHPHSNMVRWQEAIAGISPNVEYDGLKLYFLRNNKEIKLCIAWLQSELLEEGHPPEDFQESFLILEGTCQCDLGDTVVNLQPGDYLNIPFDTRHTIKVTSAPNGFLKALIQRRKAAA